jgi:hypothetical protein
MRLGLAVSAVALSLACAPEEPSSVPLPWIEAFAALDSIPPAVDSAGGVDTFGSIDAAVTLDEGGIVVVDGMNGLVRLLRDGAEIDASGGPGDGPREFRMIRHLAAFGGDSVLVLDQARHRLSILRADRDSLVWAGDTLIPIPAEDLCTLRGRLFFAGGYNSAILHEGSLDGQIVSSFGSPEGADFLSQALSSVGTLACSADADALAFVSETLGIVRVFSPDGRELRRDSIPGFVHTVYEVTGNAMRPTLPDEGYAHVVSSVQWLLGQDLLVQLSRGRRSEGVGQDVRLWLADGTWRSDLPQWPRVVAVLPDTALLTTVADPYPRLLNYRVR